MMSFRGKVDPSIQEDIVFVRNILGLDPSAAVPYRDYWFWIDDRDYRSKAPFSFLMFIFSLTETEGKEGAPIITVPAG